MEECAAYPRNALVSASVNAIEGAKWGVNGIHQATFVHQVLTHSPAKCAADRSVAHAGDDSTVNVGTYSFKHSHGQDAGPSYRHLIDMGNASNSLFLNGVGQSGAQFSPLYDNMLEKWSRGEYIRMV